MAKKQNILFPPRIFPVYKPRGIHSGDVLKHFKRNLPEGFGKIGHLGTLDPFAEGLFLIAVGQAARLSFLFELYCYKTYNAIGRLHEKSDTGDCDGNISRIEPRILPDRDVLIKITGDLTGEYWQAPPYYSAAKHEGKPLYDYARHGIYIDKPKVKREVIDIREVDYCDNKSKLKFTSEVSSGTYIRTLFEDIAISLGTLGHLEYLQRTKIGPVGIDCAMHKSVWPIEGKCFDVIKMSICPSRFFQFPKFSVNEDLYHRLENGQRVPLNYLDNDVKCLPYAWLVNDEGMLRGLFEVNSGIIKAKVMFPKLVVDR